jgi:hypothetical protein
VVVEPSFTPPYSIALVRPSTSPAGAAGDKDLRLRLVRAKKSLWAEMMHEMAREQRSVIHLDPLNQRRALAKVSRAVETTTLAAPPELAHQLTAVWAGVLARTQYAHEVLVAPDGSSRMYYTADGTTYRFWYDGRSGTTHSPPPGSLLADLVGVTAGLLHDLDGAPAKRAAQERTLKDALSRLQLRIDANEPCVRPQP